MEIRVLNNSIWELEAQIVNTIFLKKEAKEMIEELDKRYNRLSKSIAINNEASICKEEELEKLKELKERLKRVTQNGGTGK